MVRGRVCGEGFLLLRANVKSCEELGESANMFDEAIESRSLTWSRCVCGLEVSDGKRDWRAISSGDALRRETEDGRQKEILL